MIYGLYIIDQGLCIYSYRFKKDMEIDGQLLSGFLSAVGSFAQSIFSSGLQTIYIKHEKLNFLYDRRSDLLYCAISDYRDNDSLIGKILENTADAFYEKYASVLESPERNNIKKYEDFTPELLKILENRSRPRNLKTIMAGILAGSATVIGSIYLFGIIYRLLNVKEAFLAEFLILLFMSIAVSFSAVIAGFVAGSPCYGLYTGLLFFIGSFAVVGLFIPEIMNYYIFISPFSLIVCTAGGFYGGLLTERRMLYPLDKMSEIKMKIVKEALISDKD